LPDNFQSSVDFLDDGAEKISTEFVEKPRQEDVQPFAEIGLVGYDLPPNGLKRFPSSMRSTELESCKSDIKLQRTTITRLKKL
jgi:hypothetical protein